MNGAHVEVERTLDASLKQVGEVIRSPTSYTHWVEGLKSFEQREGNVYVARFGYLGYTKVATVRLDIGDGVALWERIGGNTQLRVRVSADEAGPAATRVSLAWTVSGSGFLFGQYASNPVFRSALEVMADRSLASLEAVAGQARAEMA